MSDYTCFLHPQQTGTSLDQICPQCGNSYGFPLSEGFVPEQLNSKEVESALSRGFYGAVYRTVHPRTRRTFATKVIPKATYAPKSEGGYEKNFESETRLHSALSSARVVATLEDFGEECVQFGPHAIPCFWIEMEFVEGETLEEVVRSGPSSPREIAQISWDLLDIVEALQQHGAFHNDLHGGNIKVVELGEADARRAAIHPRVGLKVLDLGSAAPETKSGEARLSDCHWVASHILSLLDSYERNSELEPTSARVCAQLRRVAQQYHGEDKVRQPTPDDMKREIHAAYSYGQRPWNQPVRLPSVSSHYNAKTLPAWFTPTLLCDPWRWSNRIMSSGPQLVSGMRGCGKTILLRSLEWAARICPRSQATSTESKADVQDRVREEGFLGLFVSCSSLLQGPRPELVDAPIRRTFLAFAREVVRNVEACELTGIGSVDYNALREFRALVERAVPWFGAPESASDPWELERALSTAVNSPTAGCNGDSDFLPETMFEELVAATRRLVDIWRDKILLFLLDDVSTRVLSKESVNDLLSRLCLQSPNFGFKISTETQTLGLRTAGGEPARLGRDFEMFDLGAEVLAKLGGPSGVSFVAEILDRRARVTDGAPTSPSIEVLGTQSLQDIAEAIRGGSSGPSLYWGLNCLAGICVGDIGDILQLYEIVLDRGVESGFPVKRDMQHKAAIELAESKLRSLLARDEWLYRHAVSFAEASHRELMRKGGRARQFTQVFVNIDAADADRVFPKILRLVDAGVFVFAGGTARSKSVNGKSALQFKLSYRKVLGLPSRIPLGRRDRFEPENTSELVDWLDNPSAEKLRWGRVPSNPEQDENGIDAERAAPADPPAQLAFPSASREKGQLARVLHSVRTDHTGPLIGAPVPWQEAHVLGAFGFEERSLGAWRELLRYGRPKRATFVRYADRGHEGAIRALLEGEGVRVDSVDLASSGDVSQFSKEIIGACGAQDTLVVDTTSLTKALIFSLVAQSLRARGELWVLHTCAEEYFPDEARLSAIVEDLVAGDILRFRDLDSLVEGEEGPYRTELIGKVARDPSQPSVLAAFVPLKHSRLTQLLDEIPVEAIAAIVPVHSSGRLSPRTIAANYLADHFVQELTGCKREVGSLDHAAAFDTLTELHRRYALASGYNFDLALTGTKMQTVGAGMLSSTAPLSAVYYSSPERFVQDKFTRGTGPTRIAKIIRTELPPTEEASPSD